MYYCNLESVSVVYPIVLKKQRIGGYCLTSVPWKRVKGTKSSTGRQDVWVPTGGN